MRVEWVALKASPGSLLLLKLCVKMVLATDYSIRSSRRTISTFEPVTVHVVRVHSRAVRRSTQNGEHLQVETRNQVGLAAAWP